MTISPAIQYEIHPQTRVFHNYGIDFDLTSPAIQDVRFEDFRLGMPRKTMIEQETPFYEKRYGDDRKVFEAAMGCLSGHPETAWDTKPWGAYYIYFEQERVAWMEFYQLGGPQLGGYAINRPATPFIAEGEFEIPAEEGR